MVSVECKSNSYLYGSKTYTEMKKKIGIRPKDWPRNRKSKYRVNVIEKKI